MLLIFDLLFAAATTFTWVFSPTAKGTPKTHGGIEQTGSHSHPDEKHLQTLTHS
ncbi:MAG: hypothetical protein J6Z14_04715 [Prevotella sp.]|nr:hypothetical protein [Prevotella sp.]